MSFFRYLRDNARLILLYFVILAFLAAMAYLDADSRMQPGNAAYTAAVSAALFAAAVFVDYRIRRSQALRWKELVQGEDRSPVLPPPADYRDELCAAYTRALYADYTESIRAIEEDFRENKEFMAAWAHEVKTPLTAARLLLEGGADDREALGAEIDRIGDCVERVLFHARSDSFSKDYVISEESLERLAKECVKKHAALFIKKRIRASVEVPEGLAVQTDRKWLLFILDQLVSNALKYTDEGGAVGITARRDPGKVVLRVADTGRGIPREDIERVFSKSFTGKAGREPGSAATGLGLYLAQKLAVKLNHVITVSSEPGRGTAAEIHFKLPDEYLDLTKL